VDALSLNGPFGSHTVPGAQLLQLVELLRFWHIEASDVLAGTDLTERELEEPQVRVPIATMNLVVSRARLLTGEPALGIFLGLRRRVSMYGFLGFAMMSASSLREALELAVQFSSTISTAVVISLHVEDGLAALRIEERIDVGDVRDVATFALVIGLDGIGKALTGYELTGKMHFAMAKPAYCDRFPELFANAHFDQAVTQLVFDANLLELPLVAPDRAGLRLARQQCERALCDLGLDRALPERVRALLARSEGMRSLREVAGCMQLSVRTFKRRLAAQGVSFSELVEQERRQRACLLLTSSQLSLNEITERLGYSTLPNFARAFRRWTGQTPAHYRRANSA
jgi:AraC-like DNA-binding protein